MYGNHVDYQVLVNKFADFIELRFGVYLDTIWGFGFNMKEFDLIRQQTMQIVQLTPQELDRAHFIRGNGPPSSDLEECGRREIHRMSQGAFKANNSPGGANYNFAIENCLSDIFNYWNTLKGKNIDNSVKEIEAFPIMGYMRDLRNHIQHELYDEKKANKPIMVSNTITSYSPSRKTQSF